VMNVAEILPLKKIRRQLIHQTLDVELKKSEGPTSASDSVRTKPAAHCPDTLRYSMHLSFFQMSRLFLHISNMCHCFDEFEHRCICFGRCTVGCAKCMKEGQ